MKKKIPFVILLIVIYAYICAIIQIPNDVVMIQGESLNIKTLLGISITSQNEKGKTLLASSRIGNSVLEEAGTYELSAKLFDTIKIKDISVSIIEPVQVVPIGRAIGMKLYTEGVLVVGKSEIEGKKSYENSDLQEGDRILQINHESVASVNELVEKVEQSAGEELAVTYQREEEQKETILNPIQTKDQKYKIGLWVRDAAAGIGTFSFYEPKTGTCIALGHGVMDIDTGELIEIAKGNLVTTKILSVKKGKKGVPGEMKGNIDSGIDVGTLEKNTSFGVVRKDYE